MNNGKIISILDGHDLLRLATITENGLPKVRSVDFARDMEDISKLYFLTFKTTNKVKDLTNNSNVHIAVDKAAHSMEELANVLYLKSTGKVELLTEPEHIGRAMEHIITKYPYLKDLPGDPSMMNVYKIQLGEVMVTDNSLGFGHTVSVNF